MSSSTNPLAAGIPALRPPSATVPMLTPQGQVSDVPVENVQAAIKDGGYKIGMDMVRPDGKQVTVPVDNAHAAISEGGYKPFGMSQKLSPSEMIGEGEELGAQGNAQMAQRYVNAGPKEIVAGASDIAQGNVARGIHRGIQGAAVTAIPAAAAAAPIAALEAPVATAGSIAGGYVGGKVTRAGAEVLGASPDQADVAEDVGNLAGGIAGAKAGSWLDNVLAPAKALLFPSEEVKSQVTKDAIRSVLGNKADADVVENAASRMGPTKIFSNVQNDLKLVKPQVDADLATNNAALDSVLADSPAKVTDAPHEVNKVFDQMVADVKNSVSTDKDPLIKAINGVRYQVVDRLKEATPSLEDAQNDTLPVKAVNDVKRLVGDEIKKFAPPENLNTSQRAEQEAFRQSYFTLRDLVSGAEPATADLNQKISNDIALQDLLQRKFPQLETAEQAKASYAGARSQQARSLGTRVAANVGKVGVIHEVLTK